MLQGLKLADQLAELLAGAQILQRDGKGLIARTVQTGCRAGPPHKQGLVQCVLSGTGLADQGIGIDLDVLQADARGIVGIDHEGALDLHALGFGIDQEQAEAFIGPGGHDQGIGHMAVQHHGLVAVQPEAVTAAFGAGLDLVRGVFGPFVDRQRQYRLARSNLGQPSLLSLATRVLQHAGRQDGTAQKGRGRQGAAKALGDHARLDGTEARAAMLFVDDHTGKAHLAKGLPQIARNAVGIAAVSQLAQMFDRGIFFQKAVHRLAQHDLFFCQDQRHGVRLPAGSAGVWR